MRYFLPVFFLALSTTVAQAAVIVSSTNVGPAPNTPGFNTWEVSLTSDLPYTGLDFTATADALGQVVLFGGALPTIFNDNNAFIALPETVQDDSQFNYNNAVGTSDFAFVAGGFSESATSLVLSGGVFNVVQPGGVPNLTAQLVLPEGVTAAIEGAVGFQTGGSDPFQGIVGADGPVIPEPASLALMGLGLAGVVSRRRRV